MVGRVAGGSTLPAGSLTRPTARPALDEAARLQIDLSPSCSINKFAQDVGMTCVPGGLFEEVHEHPAEVDWRFATHVVLAHLIETGSVLDHSIDLTPNFLVRHNRPFDRFVRVDR
jgi:hypothetical protein